MQTKLHTRLKKMLKPVTSKHLALVMTVILCVVTACKDDTFDSFHQEFQSSTYMSFKIINDTTVRSRSGEVEYGSIRNVFPLT